MRRKTTRKTSAPKRRRSTRAAVPARRRTRRVSRKRGMLSEIFDAKSAQAGAMITLEGAAGGVGAHFLGKILPAGLSAQNKALIQLGAGFVTATVLKRPNLGAGMAAIGTVDLLRGVGFLADETSADYASGMDSLPMVLNEDGSPLYLSEGDNMYLSEDYYLSEGEYSESAGSDYEVGYYPEFGL